MSCLGTRPLVDFSPASEKSFADMIHARLGIVVLRFGVVEQRLRAVAVARRERLVPHREDELIQVRIRVLCVIRSIIQRRAL